MNRKIARSGGDPRTERHKVRDMPTFAEAAARVLEQLRPGWRSPRHAQDWVSSLRVYAFPQLGHRPVGEITTADVLAVLTPIWHAKQVTARRVRQRIGAVMKWAVAMGLRPDNPASDVLGQALGRQRAVVRHMRAFASLEGRGRDRDGAEVARLPGHETRLRVPGVDGGPLGRGSLGALG